MIYWKPKLKAFFIHLLLSLTVIALFLVVVIQVWYPDTLFKLENVWQGLQVLIPVDAVLGPLLTLVLFVPGKKRLKFDLTVIALLQIAALTYGGSLIYKQRPVFLAFVVDRFEVVLAYEEYVTDIPMERFNNKQNHSPLLSYVLPPQTIEEKNQFFFAKIPFQKVGSRHYPIDDYLSNIAEKSLKVNRLTPKNENSRRELAQFKKKHTSPAMLLLFPLQASTQESIIIVLDRKTGQFVDYLSLDPWSEYQKKAG